jgi:hypothetical protein
MRIYKTIILPVVLYGCETWSLMLREEHRLRIFGPKRDELTGGRRKLHNEELRDLYSSSSIIIIYLTKSTDNEAPHYAVFCTLRQL